MRFKRTRREFDTVTDAIVTGTVSQVRQITCQRLTFVLVLEVQVPRVIQAASDNPHGRNAEAAKRLLEISKPEKEPGQVKVTIGELAHLWIGRIDRNGSRHGLRAAATQLRNERVARNGQSKGRSLRITIDGDVKRQAERRVGRDKTNRVGKMEPHARCFSA
jgi:hypothetical protein